MAEHLHDLLAFHHLLDISVDRRKISLLRQERSAGNAGKLPGQEEHQTGHGQRQQGEHRAQHQHAGNDRHDRQAAVDELRNALAHQLPQGVHVIRII